MAKKLRYRHKNRFKLCLLTGSILLFLLTTFKTLKTFANEENNNINTPVLFQPPPGEKPPEDTEGGGSRDDGNSCDRDIVDRRSSASDRSTLTAIAPIGYNGLTTVERPTLWIDLPETSAQQAILLIKEGSDSNWQQLMTHWQQSINVKGKAGIIGIKLAQDAPPLEIGKNYQWVVALVCGDRPNPNDPLVAAGIKRVAESQITTGVPTTLTQLERASLYAKKGVWYDALDILVAEKSSLSNWNDIWIKYLQSGGLADNFALKPVIGELSNK